jgi:hypothetical protein
VCFSAFIFVAKISLVDLRIKEAAFEELTDVRWKMHQAFAWMKWVSITTNPIIEKP